MHKERVNKMEDQVTTMSRLDAEKGIELLKEMTPEQQVSILLKAQSFPCAMNVIRLSPLRAE